MSAYSWLDAMITGEEQQGAESCGVFLRSVGSAKRSATWPERTSIFLPRSRG